MHQVRTDVLTQSITQTANLPNVQIVDAHGAESCNIFAFAQSSSPAYIDSEILANARLSLGVSLVQLSKPAGYR